MALVPGFPQSTGAKRESVITKVGPAAYSAISVATPPTGGQDVDAASEFGMKYIEFLEGSGSDDGQYFVRCIPTKSAKEVTTWKLMWCTAIDGAETTGDLSGRTVRLRAIGL